MTAHLLTSTACTMREFYDRENMIATSIVATTALIRSHIAYHAGRLAAERAEINPSRGHSYRIDLDGQRTIVRITDYYDHRNGIKGFVVLECA